MICVSSEPEARRRPDRDQLESYSVSSARTPRSMAPAGEDAVPQSVDASLMTTQLVHDVQIVYPSFVAIDSPHIAVSRGVAQFSLVEAVVQGVFHYCASSNTLVRHEIRLCRIQSCRWMTAIQVAGSKLLRRGHGSVGIKIKTNSGGRSWRCIFHSWIKAG